MKTGQLLVFTGNGKGKTTAALGLALRAVGHGLRVGFLQFIKGNLSCGEHKAAERLAPFLEIRQLGSGFLRASDGRFPPEAYANARQQWERAKPLILASPYEMLVLDELCYLLLWGLLPVEEVADVVRRRDPGCHLVITGRGAPPELVALADTVTEMTEVKHAFTRGVPAEKGIEL